MVRQRLLHGEGEIICAYQRAILPATSQLLLNRCAHPSKKSNGKLVQLLRATPSANTTPAMLACGMLYLQLLDFLYTLAL